MNEIHGARDSASAYPATRRLRGDAALRGSAKYVADVSVPGMLHVALVRSPHARAAITEVDVRRAACAEGVVATLTGAEADALARPLSPYIDASLFGGRAVAPTCMASDRVRYAGQPVAAVVASSPALARHAATLVEVKYERAAPVLEVHAAAAPGASVIEPGWTDNVLISGRIEHGDVDAAEALADHVLHGELEIQRYATAPLEPRAYVATWDDGAAFPLTIYATTQNPHQLRWLVAQTLDLAENAIRVIVPRLGGSFGLKMPGLPEEILVPMLSRLLHAPVKWVEDRTESLLIGAREQSHAYTVSFESDGTITSLRNRILVNVGAVAATPGWTMGRLTAVTLPCAYRIQNYIGEYICVVTNKGPWNAARGYGKEAAALLMERVVDTVAAHLDLDPVDVRANNLVSANELPYRTAAGLNLDSGDYVRELHAAAELGQYASWRRRQAAARRQNRLLGIGVSFEVTPEGGGIPGTLVADFDTSTVRVEPSGAVTVLTGVTAPGGGNETGIAQVVAAELGIEPSEITVVQGDTAACPYGFGNYSGRGILVGASSAALAARDVRDELAKVAARLLECACDEIDIAGGRFLRRGAAGAVTLREIAEVVYRRTASGDAEQPGRLEATRSYRPGNISHEPDAEGRIQPYPSYSNAAYVAVVQVDAETGVVDLLDLAVVHDCGTIINERLVEGQIRGAVAMGVGAALSEHLVYDDDGVLSTDRLKSYVVPRAPDVPPIRVGHQVTPSPFTLLGTKGAGEAGVGGAAAAVASAVADALIPLGAVIRRFPLTPPTVLRAINEAAAQQLTTVAPETAGAPLQGSRT